MSTDRLLRVNELLKREIGELLFRVMQRESIDLSAVTVTHVVTSRNLRHARVLVSIRDHENERQRMLGMIRRHRGEIQACINKDIGLKFTPCLEFELDTSVEKGDRILSLISVIEQDLHLDSNPGEAPSGEPIPDVAPKDDKQE